jgi:hypothetical protein
LKLQFNDKLNFGCSLTLAGYGYPFTQVRGPQLPLEVDGKFDCDVWWNEVARGADGKLFSTGHRIADVIALAPKLDAGDCEGLREHPQNPRRGQLFPHGCRPKPVAAGQDVNREWLNRYNRTCAIWNDSRLTIQPDLTC